MNKLFFALGLGMICVADSAFAATSADYLLLTVSRQVYSSAEDGAFKDAVTRESYKVELSALLLAELQEGEAAKNLNCSMQDRIDRMQPGLDYTQWFALDAGKLRTWFWASGSADVNGERQYARQGTASVSLRFPDWRSLSTSEQLSFVTHGRGPIHGVNVTFSSEVVAAGDERLRAAAHAELTHFGDVVVKGDAVSPKFSVSCLIQ